MALEESFFVDNTEQVFQVSWAQKLVELAYISADHDNAHVGLVSFGQGVSKLEPSEKSDNLFSRNKTTLASALTTFINDVKSDVSKPARLADYEQLFELYGRDLNSTGGTFVIFGAGIPWETGMKQKAVEQRLVAARASYPRLSVICVYNQRKKGKRPALFEAGNGLCDSAFIKQRDANTDATVAATRNLICAPDEARLQADPCAQVNELPDASDKLKKRMCTSVKGNYRGQDVGDLGFADLTFMMINYCTWDTSAKECSVRPEYSNLFSNFSNIAGGDTSTGTIGAEPGDEYSIGITVCSAIADEKNCTPKPDCDWISRKTKKGKPSSGMCRRTTCASFLSSDTCLKTECNWYRVLTNKMRKKGLSNCQNKY